MKKRVAVLGATGSIGKSTLDVLRRNPDRFEPVLFSAHSGTEALIRLRKEFPGALTAITGYDPPVPEANNSPPGMDFYGKEGLLHAISAAKADITVNGISGAAGLEPSAAALNAGSDLALANKETIVMAGEIIFSLAAKNKVRIIPVDSEHAAIMKLIEAHSRENTTEIILTASGGPFRNYPKEKLAGVTAEEALAHPTWNMGPKITIDSATLANKGLEVIEASRYFNFPADKIKVVIHPQSMVHSMIRLLDGAVYAQMSKPDMRLVIHDALTWPETEFSPFGAMDFDSLTLNFEKCKFEQFPMLGLAYRALEGTPLLPAVYNAANEKAVEAFMKGELAFLEIPELVGYVLDKYTVMSGENGITDIEAVFDADRTARELAGHWRKSGCQNAASSMGADNVTC